MVGETREVILTTELNHWANTAVSYHEDGEKPGTVGAYPLMDLFPELDQLSEGIKLKVTVEVLDEGTPCPVKVWDDDMDTCTCERYKD